MNATLCLFLHSIALALCDPVSSQRSREVPNYLYWQPEFPRRFDTPTKRKALDALLSDYSRLIVRIKELTYELDVKRLTGVELKELADERATKIERVKLLDSEIKLWRH